MELAENSLDDFNRTECSRSRSRSRSRFSSPSEKKLSDPRRSRSRHPPEKKLSDTREKKSEKKSKKKSEKKLSDTRYKEEKKSSSSSSEDDEFSSSHDCCGHGTTKEDSKAFNRYVKQVRDSKGYEASFIPGGFCESIRVFPCDVDREGEFFNETCRKCIAEYNKKHTDEPDYELLDVVMATKRPCTGYIYNITFRAHQVHLPVEVKTFRARYYHCSFKDNYGEVCDCELKD